MSITNVPSSKAVREALEPLVKSGGLAGALALVVSSTEALSLDTVGSMNLEAGTAMSPDATFWIASMTKPITAAALMMLVDEGKLSIDDPVAKHIPEFTDQWLAVLRNDELILLKKPSQTMTVRHLLTHTSGMPFSSYIERPTLDFLPLREGVYSYIGTPLNTEPGTAVAYSNAGINTAGRLIELLSGMDYISFMESRLFGPLGMADTTFIPNEEQISRLAQPYRANAEAQKLDPIQISQLQYPLSNPARNPMPAGGLFSTAADCARFCQLFLNEGQLDGVRYIKTETVHAMSKKQTADAIPDKVGLGFFLSDDGYGHGGALATNMWIYPSKDRALIYLIQHSGFLGEGGEGWNKFQKAALES